MISTGITGLDQRLGGVSPGSFFLLTGTPGAGKTSACLHFIAEGLKSGETCALLTQESPDDIFARARYIGQDFEHAVEESKLVILQYRLDFSTNYASAGSPQAVARELVNLIEGARPTRLVVDSILPFVQAGSVSHGAVSALLHVMDALQPTSYFTVPGDLGDRLYDPLVSSAAGVLHFEIGQDDVRNLSIRKIRQAPISPEPLRFVIRAGLGIVEYTDTPVSPIPEASRKRVALINTSGRVSGDFFASLRREYDLALFDSLESALPSVSRESFGALLVAIEPKQPEAAFSFVHALRKAGNRVPVVLIAQSDGLRSATRARGLRAGADEFVTDDASPQEFISRIESARSRGPRSGAERLRRETLLVQPRDPDGKALPISESELVRAVRQHITTSAHPFFAIVRLQPLPGRQEEMWDTLCMKLRVADGDLIATTPSGDLVLYLHDVSRRHVSELLGRLFEADPRVAQPLGTDIQHYPADSGRIDTWLTSNEAGQQVRAHA